MNKNHLYNINVLNVSIFKKKENLIWTFLKSIIIDCLDFERNSTT